MRLRLWGLAVVCAVAVAGCNIQKSYPVGNSDINKATEKAKADIQDPLAVIPQWYRDRCKPDWWKSEETKHGIFVDETTESANAWINPIPLWRLVAICSVFFPILILIALNPFSKATQDKMYGGQYRAPADRIIGGIFVLVLATVVALAAPFVLCWPVNWIFRLLAFGFMGEAYYAPWDFIAFLMFAVLLLVLTVAAAKPLVRLLKSGFSVKGALGTLGLILEVAGLIFTVRQIWMIATGN